MDRAGAGRGAARRRVIAVFGVANYPDLDQVREVVGALPVGFDIVTGGHSGPELETARIARKRGAHVDVIRRYRVDSGTWVDALKMAVFEDRDPVRLIAFWWPRHIWAPNTVDVYQVCLEARRRGCDCLILTPAGAFDR